MNPDHRKILRSGIDAYLERHDTALEPNDEYLSYDFHYISEAKWCVMVDVMLKDYLEGITNKLHHWRDMLRSWQAWNDVVAGYDQHAAWFLRRQIIEPLMHWCLITPSTFRDVMTLVGTNAIHQIRRHTESGYKDHMEGEKTAAEPKPKYLKKHQKEERLFKLALPLSNSRHFTDALRILDSKAYQTATKEYRNRNSHAFGPRIALGITQVVTREIVPDTNLDEQPDGTFLKKDVPGRFKTRYGCGGVHPLDPERARDANLEQYRLTRKCFDHLTSFLAEHAAKLPRANA